MRDILNLRFVQHCKRSNFTTVIQCVPQHLPVLLSLPLLLLLLLSPPPPLLLLLLLLMLSLPPRLLGKMWLSGATDEALSPPLHFVEQAEVASGT